MYEFFKNNEVRYVFIKIIIIMVDFIVIIDFIIILDKYII